MHRSRRCSPREQSRWLCAHQRARFGVTCSQPRTEREYRTSPERSQSARTDRHLGIPSTCLERADADRIPPVHAFTSPALPRAKAPGCLAGVLPFWFHISPAEPTDACFALDHLGAVRALAIGVFSYDRRAVCRKCLPRKSGDSPFVCHVDNCVRPLPEGLVAQLGVHLLHGRCLTDHGGGRDSRGDTAEHLVRTSEVAA